MRYLVTFLVLGLSTAHGCAGSSRDRAVTARDDSDISTDVLRAHVAVLAADSLSGRYSPSAGLNQAARYAAEQLRASGWEPLGNDGSLVRFWPHSFTRLDLTRASLTAEGCGQTARLEAGLDLMPMYAGVDEAQGAPVLLASTAEVGTGSLNGRFPVVRVSGGDPSALVHEGMARALTAGAVAFAVVVPDTAAELTPRLAEGLSRMNHTGIGVPAAIVSNRGWLILEQLLDRCPTASLVWRGRVRVDSGPVPNVVAVLRGRDPRLRHEHVVLSAHLDHEGVGLPDATGDSIYNGADDNASGVALVLSVAQALRHDPPRRSVIVLLPGGEEQGMRGTRHFADRPPVDWSSIVANINVDGVGRAWQKDTVSAAGFEYSTLGATVAAVLDSHPEVGLTVVPDQWPQLRIFEFSDQIVFARGGIPSIFFTSTGPDRHYHQPSDHLETLDFDHLERLAHLVLWTTRAVADGGTPPQWDPEARERIVQSQEVSASEAIDSSKQMPDGKRWTTTNLNVDLVESYCYEDAEPNCRRYGRLYSWHSARRGCQALGGGWRLPTNDDWFQLAQRFGGIRDESAEAGRAAYVALSPGGSSGFNALLGGGRAPDGREYSRSEAHGFYWTASETGPTTAWFYNFGNGQSSLGRHEDGEKQRAFSVRCVRDT